MKPALHLVLALAVCALALSGYTLWYDAVSAKSASVAALQKQIDSKTAVVKRVAATSAAITELSGDEAVVQSYFVPTTGVVAFIDGLERRGAVLGAAVTVQSVSNNDKIKPPTLELSLSVDGPFDAVMRTVGAIEFMPYDIAVASFTMSALSDAKGSWRATVKLSVGSLPATASTTSTTP